MTTSRRLRRAVTLMVLALVLSLSAVALACDTYVALGNSTANGQVLFAKSSNRSSEECMRFPTYPGGTHAPGEMVKVSWIEIPQVPVTYSVKGCQPWWGYGFEMGTNEWGVCAGNEALPTKEAVPKDKLDTSLTGMDLLRLGLERGKTAYEAMHVVIDLMEKYGQFGRCAADKKSTSNYFNSYIWADPNEAWVLETSGKDWVAKKVTDVWSVDNVCTIEDEYDECSPGLIKKAIANGWYDPRDRFNFNTVYSVENFSEVKFARVMDLLRTKKGSIDLPYMMQISRDRLEGTFLRQRYMPEHFYRHIDGTTATASTAGVMVCQLNKDAAEPLRNVVWIAEASPTTSVFSPHYFIADPPAELAIGNDQYDPKVPWWSFDLLDRMSRENYEYYTPVIRSVWAQFEKELIVDASMVQKEASRLYKAGQIAQAKSLLTDFERKNLDKEVGIANTLASMIRQLHTVLPGRYIKYQATDAGNINAGVDLW